MMMMMMMMMNLCKASSACRLIVERSTFLSARAAHLITIVIRRNDHWSALSWSWSLSLSWHDHHDINYQVTWLRLFPQGDSSLVESVDVEPAQIFIVKVSSYIRCSVFIYQMCAKNHHCHFSFVVPKKMNTIAITLLVRTLHLVFGIEPFGRGWLTAGSQCSNWNIVISDCYHGGFVIIIGDHHEVKSEIIKTYILSFLLTCKSISATSPWNEDNLSYWSIKNMIFNIWQFSTKYCVNFL